MTTMLQEHDGAADPAAATSGTNLPPEEVVYPYVLRDVDPSTLLTEGNSREVGDIRERHPQLVASVAEHGLDPMISMISVAPAAEDQLEVLVGFHRAAAAAAVAQQENPGLRIPLLVHAPGTTRQSLLVAQGLENLHRLGLSTLDEASLYEQLALTGLGEGDIARQLATPLPRVQAGRAVAASATTRTATEHLPDTDLLTMAELAEFADDEEAHTYLVDVLMHDPEDFAIRVMQLRERRARHAVRIQTQQHFSDQGYALIEDELRPPEGALPLDELCANEADHPLTPTVHTQCPGRAVAIEVDSDHAVEVIEFCADYAAHGHRSILAVQVAAAEESLRADGVPIVDPEDEDVTRLGALLADQHAHEPLTADQHASCPGHAAYVDAGTGETEIVHVCTDPAAHGHVWRYRLTTSRGSAPETGPGSAAYTAGERRRAGINNKRWREAKADRRVWLKQYFTGWRKRKATDLPQRVHQWLALAAVLAASYLEDAAPGHRYACGLLKLAEPTDYRREANPLAVLLNKKTTTDTQAVLIRLAQVLGACEQHWDIQYTNNADSSWRAPTEDSRFYFAFLDALGCPLSPVEELINNPELDNENWPHLAPDPAPVGGADDPESDGSEAANPDTTRLEADAADTAAAESDDCAVDEHEDEH